MKRPPPRLHVIPATGCDKALILRRGPSEDVASILWDRDRGTFETGQWLKGRIYEHRCDLSPDARHMIVFARRTDAALAWTALSRAPWLRAIAIWPQSHTWHGGGAFDDRGRVWLNGRGAPDTPLPDRLKPAKDDAYPHGTDGFHMGDFFAAMMVRRGWTHVGGKAYDSVLTKSLGQGWELELRFRLREKNRGIISNAYALVNDAESLYLDQPGWEWAEPHGGGLQFAQRGALFRCDLPKGARLPESSLIRDFTEMQFEAIDAPYSGITGSLEGGCA